MVDLQFRVSRPILILGLSISLLCWLYLFAEALRVSRIATNDITNLSSLTTAVTWHGRVVGFTFFVLNMPPTIVLLLLDRAVPTTMTPATRVIVIYLLIGLVVFGWWLLARVTGRKPRQHRVE